MADTQTKTDRAPVPFAGHLDADTAALPGAAVAWVRHAREEGAALWRAHGAPTVRTEAWKYTNLRQLLKTPFEPARAAQEAAADGIPAADALTLDAHVLAFVNGRFAPELSDLDALPQGVAVASLASLLETEPHSVEAFCTRQADAGELPFAALNQAMMTDGFVVRVREGAVVDKPLHIIQVSAAEAGAPTIHHPRNVIALETGATATVVESWIGMAEGPETLRNAVTEIHVGQGATLRHAIFQNLPEDTGHGIAATVATVEQGGTYDSFVLQVGGRLSRHDLRVLLNGEKAEARLNGAYGVTGERHVDTTTFIDHAVPRCTSNEVYKGVLSGRSKGVFQGKILVRKDAQQTDGNQLHRALLLDRGAEVDCKPELEIYADDVTCSHGATTGEIDKTALFYLRSRGIDEQTARMLLIEGFLEDVVDSIGAEPLRDAFAEALRAWQRRALGHAPEPVAP